MIAYNVVYNVRGKERKYDILIDAKDFKSAKRKIGRMHGYKDGRMIVVQRSSIIGYL